MADVTKIKLPDNSEYNLKDHRIPGVDTTPTSGSDNVVTSGGIYNKINEITGTYGNAKIFYGTCASSAASTAKVVTCDAFSSSDLVKGALIFVTFSNTNSGAVASLTMNVNSTGAKHITKLYNTTANPDLTSAGEIKANKTYLFGYDGTNWVCLTLDYNNSYTSMTDAEIIAGTGTTARSITPARLKTAIQTWSVQADWNTTNTSSPSYIVNKPTIPSAVSDLTNDLGFTSNTGTLTGITMNGVSKGTSGVVDLGNVVTSETDPVFSESAAAGITSADISKWNSAGNAKIFYGTCNSQPDSINKVVACSDFTNTNLVKGALIFVTFDYTNNVDVEDVKLNVNNTGSLYIRELRGEYNSVSYLRYNSILQANCTYLFTYNGTYWVLLTGDSDTDTKYSIISQSEAQTGTSTTGQLVSPASLKRDIEYRMAQNQADWNETTTTSPSYIKNKPNALTGVKFNNTNATINGTVAEITATIPAAVTESTVAGWGFTKNTGTYSKPSGGIPATDLESAVQTSLGKADTALQSFTETDPTVPTWAKQSTKPTYTASEVGALPDTTVIPTVPTNVSAFTNDVNYVKYVLCTDETAYNAISSKDSGTLYLIPKT